MKKHKVVKVCGVRTVVELKKDHDRPMQSRGTVFRSKKDYNRQKAKQQTKREANDASRYFCAIL